MKRTSLPIKLINKWGESRCFNLIRDKTKQDPPVDLTVSTRLEKFPESETKYGKEAGDKSRETCGRMKGSRVEKGGEFLGKWGRERGWRHLRVNFVSLLTLAPLFHHS